MKVIFITFRNECGCCGCGRVGGGPWYLSGQFGFFGIVRGMWNQRNDSPMHDLGDGYSGGSEQLK